MVREIHAHPELCFHEQRMSAFVPATARIGCDEVMTSFSKAGVVGAVMAAATFDLIWG
ncbi:amidohydrolase [Mesorhizobium sp. M1A.F.Ca.IN.022.07.1.1]|uniref:amidohydrolase n=1 Tax=Mesorhizobium sp. M1A.F.Ca.IN.022.07.1.1 TaxID=2496767 RepID=UPI001215463A|nr:amidohydrolase [Mesorhizobium sp. M1A.F.Ca.IN.022.07.1.1]TIS71706.1 MAG: amidohydrolase [Mesorhizobium sp.]